MVNRHVVVATRAVTQGLHQFGDHQTRIACTVEPIAQSGHPFIPIRVLHGESYA